MVLIKQYSTGLFVSYDSSWNFWRLSHACHISKMRHNKAETSVSPEKNDMIEKNEISQMGGAYLMSQKLKICKCISYACLTVIWLVNSGSIELCEIIYQLNFIYLCISYFLSTNVQSYQKNISSLRLRLLLETHFLATLLY